jgi:hypothetical protein
VIVGELNETGKVSNTFETGTALKDGEGDGDGCSNFSGSSAETGIYHVGQLAVENIIQKVGMAGLFKLMRSTGEQGWESAVKEVFGVTARELNSELAQVINRETLLARSNSNIESFCSNNPRDPDC